MEESREGLEKLYERVIICTICRQPYGSDIKEENGYCPQGRCGK